MYIYYVIICIIYYVICAAGGTYEFMFFLKLTFLSYAQKLSVS